MAVAFTRRLTAPRDKSFYVEEIDGAALETLVMQELRATNANEALGHLRLFKADYKAARCTLLYAGDRAYEFDDVRVLPVQQALPRLAALLA